MLLFFPIAGSDFIQSRINSEKYNYKKLLIEKEVKLSYEEDLRQCRRELQYLVKNRKARIQNHVFDGISSKRSISLWKDEVGVTRQFCQMFKESIEESKNKIVFYTKEINTIQESK